MKTKHSIVPVALLSSLTLVAGLAFAGDEDYPTNPERSFTTQTPPPARSRADVLAELNEFRRSPVTADGWQDVGGERGETMIPRKYGDNSSYAAASPSRIWTEEELKMASLNYRNAP